MLILLDLDRTLINTLHPPRRDATSPCLHPKWYALAFAQTVVWIAFPDFVNAPPQINFLH